MAQCDTKSGFKLGTVTLTMAICVSLTSCVVPEQEPLSPVADPKAPMRVSTARVTTAPADAVGQLFNDGPRQVMTYSVNTDPLSVLFRDPAFVVKLTPTAKSKRVPLQTNAPAPTASASAMSVGRTAASSPIEQNRPDPIEPVRNEKQRESVASQRLAPATIGQSDAGNAKEMATGSTANAMTTAARSEIVPETIPVTEAIATPITKPLASAAAPVAVAAGTATVAPDVPANPPKGAAGPVNESVALKGLEQQSAGWPIPTKPSNVFGAKGPDGTAWRGLVYKSSPKASVKAIDSGRVVYAQPLRGYGNLMIIDHGKDYTSIYGYNEALTKKVGDIVRRGETVALVGSSGPLAYPALYFEIRKGSLPINPAIYLATSP
jgi:murein DD-endopeptidase MepM/ murein hydrolase activator NlpD